MQAQYQSFKSHQFFKTTKIAVVHILENNCFFLPTLCIKMQHDLVCIYVLEDVDQNKVFIQYNGLIFRLDHFFAKDLKNYHRRIQDKG